MFRITDISRRYLRGLGAVLLTLGLTWGAAQGKTAAASPPATPSAAASSQAPSSSVPASPQPSAPSVKSPAPGTMPVIDRAMYTKYSYRGTPDLGLTLALVEAGGGPTHFHTTALLHVLAGPHFQGELAHLQGIYGKARVTAFTQTMNFAVIDLATLLKDNHIALPAAPRISPKDGRALALEVYRDGIAANGKYDCGYMMEHLMSHPIHVAMMHDINNQRGYGPRHNANFHIVLTQVVKDLKTLYG